MSEVPLENNEQAILASELDAVKERLKTGEFVADEQISRLLGEAALRITELETIAYSDYLTGVSSRRYFDEYVRPKLEQFCLGERRRNSPDDYFIGFADLNDLKKVNDQLGHDAGDALICTAAQRLKGLLRSEDTVTRYSSKADEFLFIIPLEGINPENYSEIEQVIVKRLDGNGLSIAVGFSLLASHSDVDSAIKAAETAMMLDKEAKKQEVFDNR